MPHLLEVDGVSVAFGGLHALSDVSIAVAEGSIVGLIGPNGAGKTTLFNVVSGLQRSAGGSVKFAGEHVTELPAHRRAALGIGRSFQNLGLIGDQAVGVNLMAAQHLAAEYQGLDLLARPWRWRQEEKRLRERAQEAAEAFGLVDLWSEQVSDLSFGVARFVELACVLVERPRMMLLDEPTTGLDPGEITQLLDVLRSQQQAGTTILVVAHDVRFVMELCEYVYVLSEGRLIFDGPPAAAQRDPGVIAAYLGRPA